MDCSQQKSRFPRTIILLTLGVVFYFLTCGIDSYFQSQTYTFGLCGPLDMSAKVIGRQVKVIQDTWFQYQVSKTKRYFIYSIDLVSYSHTLQYLIIIGVHLLIEKSREIRMLDFTRCIMQIQTFTRKVTFQSLKSWK